MNLPWGFDLIASERENGELKMTVRVSRLRKTQIILWAAAELLWEIWRDKEGATYRRLAH